MLQKKVTENILKYFISLKIQKIQIICQSEILNFLRSSLSVIFFHFDHQAKNTTWVLKNIISFVMKHFTYEQRCA